MKWSETFTFSRRVRLRLGVCLPFWFYMLFFGGGLFAIIALAGLIGHIFHGDGGGWMLIWIGVGLGGALGSAAYLGSEWTAAVVRLKDTGVERQSFRGIHVYLEIWHWPDIALCRLDRVEDAGKEFAVLVLCSHTGECVPLGLPRSGREDKIQEWFETRKLPLRLEASTSPLALTYYLARPFPPSETKEASPAG